MQAFEVLSSLDGVEVASGANRLIAVVDGVEIVVEGAEISVPFNRLFLSTSNVRKKRNALSIPELAAMIEAQSLLSRLCVVAEVKKGKATGRFGVIAGGRRLEALALLVSTGRFADDALIGCKVFSSSRAIDVSLVENAGQEPMHPADMAEAFKKLVDDGKSVAEIAGAYGLSELTVERRLKIANLAPQFLQMYRDGTIEPKQMQALALTNDHAKQISAWDSLPPYHRSEYYLKNALTQDEMSMDHALAKFVGLEAYELAGGAVRRDLFGDANDGFLQDPQLVQSLATRRFENAAEELRAAGWKWVEVRQEFGYSDRARFIRIFPKTAKATPDERAAIDGLDDMLRFLREQANATEHLSNVEGRDMTDEEQTRYDELDDQIHAIGSMRTDMEASLSQWIPSQLATAGVVVTMTNEGNLSIVEGLVREEDQKTPKGGSMTRAAEKVKPAFSERLLNSLTAHRTAAVAAALTDNPHVAMVALLHRLILAEGHSYVESPIRINLTDSGHRVRDLATSFAETPAATALEAARDRWGSKLPAEPAALFGYLLAQDSATLGELLALHVARSFDAIRGREQTGRAGFDVSAAIIDALDVDMADYWAATPAHYLDSVPKAKMIEAVTEACGEAEAAPLAKMKKAEAIAAAAAKLDGKRWLPAPLRRVAPTSDVVEDGGADLEDGANDSDAEID